MYRAVAALLLSGLCLFGNPQEDVNVNSRYTVESVYLADGDYTHLSASLRQDLDAVVGQKLDESHLEHLATRIRRDLRVQNVAFHVRRGEAPDHVRVEFEIQGGRRKAFDVDIPKAAYYSPQGFTGIVDATTNIRDTALSLGLVSDGDELVERFSGIRARVEQHFAGARRVRVAFDVGSYHQQWNGSTLRAVDGSSLGLYRSRQSFRPSATLTLTPQLTWTVAVAVEQLEMQLPAAGTQSANSVENTLRFHQGWEDTGSDGQDLDAAYTLRAATGALGSDFTYVRHAAHVRYELARGNSGVTVEFIAGGLTGRAPMFERFVLGNASTLRGWNKFDLDPAGADRVVHGSVDYRYRYFTVFYDTGVLWTNNESTGPKQAAGCGFRRGGKDGMLLAIAFPLRMGRVDPVLIAGFNF